ncbi:MAG: hypothetical protein K2Y01_05735 [Rhabdochlamydiaceae bacterium]|nr:hypothetical protein [Rhabdochlamydiaceae bacterium]
MGISYIQFSDPSTGATSLVAVETSGTESVEKDSSSTSSEAVSERSTSSSESAFSATEKASFSEDGMSSDTASVVAQTLDFLSSSCTAGGLA